jgi:hypothetical protein
MPTSAFGLDDFSCRPVSGLTPPWSPCCASVREHARARHADSPRRTTPTQVPRAVTRVSAPEWIADVPGSTEGALAAGVLRPVLEQSLDNEASSVTPPWLETPFTPDTRGWCNSEYRDHSMLAVGSKAVSYAA